MKRKKLPTTTLKLLLARSGGFCENPECNADLFKFFSNKTFTDINEAAHIIPVGDTGPRSGQPLQYDVDSPENILLLCPTCHTIIDKAPKNYPAQTLYQWKESHETLIRNIFNNNKVSSREELAAKLKPLLDENYFIYIKFGPTKENEGILLSDDRDQWDKFVFEKIIPNNRMILSILKENLALLTTVEKNGYYEYVLHKEGFEYSHLTDIRSASTPLFPRKLFDSILGV